MATITVDIPDDLVAEFEALFSSQDQNEVITRLLRDAVARVLNADAGTPGLSEPAIRTGRDLGHP
jgi:metal-responsive CopG/Arc/MetJ family transcriptional regulator